MPFFQIDFLSIDNEKITKVYFAKSTHLAQRIAKTLKQIMIDKRMDNRWNFFVYKIDRCGYELEVNLSEIDCETINIIIDAELKKQIINYLLKDIE